MVVIVVMVIVMVIVVVMEEKRKRYRCIHTKVYTYTQRCIHTKVYIYRESKSLHKRDRDFVCEANAQLKP